MGQYYDVINFILMKWFHVQYDFTEFLLLPSKSMRVVISRKYLKCTIVLGTEKLWENSRMTREIIS